MADGPLAMNQSELTAYGLFWGQIEAAAAAHMDTATMWQTIRDQAAQLGMEGPGVSAAAVMRLRGYAGQIVAASEAFDRSNPAYAIDASMVSQTPWSRSLEVQALAPMYQVRYQAFGTDAEGNDASSWLTTVYTGTLPDTVGGLADSIFSSASDIVATSDGEYEALAEVSSVGNIQIMAV